jgi:putative phosphoesterase
VIALLNKNKDSLLCVRGNCDTEVDQMVLEFPILAPYALLSLDKRLIFATHGHIHNKDNLPPLKTGDILLHGHSHIPTWSEENGILILNPGSVTIPKGNSCRSYMIWEDHQFTWKDLGGVPYHSLTL